MLNAILIGYGYWGPNIARNLAASSEYKLAAICDLDESKLARARGIYGDSIQYFTDSNKALALPDIDVAAVALRNHAAQRVARNVLERGINLFMEKPLATNIEDAKILNQLAEKHNSIICVDHIMIYNPYIRRIKDMLDSGELGDIVYFESNRSNLGPYIKKDMNAMWDLAVHDVAVVDYLCNGQAPVSVNCIGQKQFGNEEIVTYLTVKYDAFVSMIKSSWFSPIKERSMIVCGTKKMVVFNDLKSEEKLAIYDKGIDLSDQMYSEYGKLEAKVRLGDVYLPNIDHEDSLQNALNHFAYCIKNNSKPLSNADTAMRVVEILLKADGVLKENV